MDKASEALMAKGQRPTPARMAVLSVLMQAQNALSHPEISRRLTPENQFDRVTVYRVLEWLVEQGLAHTVASDDRVRRFQATHENVHRHAHFECLHCGKVYCLRDIQPQINQALPPNFSIQFMDLNVRGTCAECASNKPEK